MKIRYLALLSSILLLNSLSFAQHPLENENHPGRQNGLGTSWQTAQGGDNNNQDQQEQNEISENKKHSMMFDYYQKYSKGWEITCYDQQKALSYFIKDLKKWNKELENGKDEQLELILKQLKKFKKKNHLKSELEEEEEEEEEEKEP